MLDVALFMRKFRLTGAPVQKIVSSVFLQNLTQRSSEVWVLTTAHREAFPT